jgi:hypothetical protein
MRTILYRRWAPPASPVRIEFPPELLHQIRAESLQPQDRGCLFGRHQGRELRVLAAVRHPHAGDPRIQGLELVGAYVSRPRGEVFLTDADLEHLDSMSGLVSLVVAGSRAGFFPREDDGSLRAVRSYEEFAVADAAAEPEPGALPPPSMPRQWRHPAIPPAAAWKWALAAAVLVAVPVGAQRYLAEHARLSPLDLSVRELNGQLLIRWELGAISEHGARLEINDSGTRTVLHVAPGTSSATYTLRSGDVEVRLNADRRTGAARWASGKWGSLYNKTL